MRASSEHPASPPMELTNYSTLPEAYVDPDSTLPEATSPFHNTFEHQPSNPEVQRIPVRDDKEPLRHDRVATAAFAEPGNSRIWGLKRKKFFMLGAIMGCIIIGALVSGLVGAKVGQEDSSNSATSPKSSPSSSPDSDERTSKTQTSNFLVDNTFKISARNCKLDRYEWVPALLRLSPGSRQ